MAGRDIILTYELKDHVKKWFKANPKISARKAQNKIINMLIAQKMRECGNIITKKEAMEELTDEKIIPGVSVIGKFLTTLRDDFKKHTKEINDLDTPWSIGCCIEFGISADTIPLLVELWQILSDKDQLGGDISSSLTIRKARWMSLLYPTLKRSLESKFPNQRNKQIGYLSRISDEYMELEEAANRLGRKYSNTKLLDTLLFYRDDIGLNIDEALLLARFGDMSLEEWNNFIEINRTVVG